MTGWRINTEALRRSWQDVAVCGFAVLVAVLSPAWLLMAVGMAGVGLAAAIALVASTEEATNDTYGYGRRSWRVRICAIVALGLWIVSAVAAHAQCAPHDVVAAQLAEGYGEHRHVAGLDAQGALIEVWGAKGGTWTITRTLPGGPTCLVAVGDAFDPTVRPLPDAGEPG